MPGSRGSNLRLRSLIAVEIETSNTAVLNAQLHALMTKLDISKASVAGYSMGGRCALAFAAAYPDKVDKLVIIGGHPGLETKTAEQRKIKK